MGSQGISTGILWLAFSLHGLSQEPVPHFLLEPLRYIAGPSALAQVPANPERRQMPPEEYEKVCAQVLPTQKSN